MEKLLTIFYLILVSFFISPFSCQLTTNLNAINLIILPNSFSHISIMSQDTQSLNNLNPTDITVNFTISSTNGEPFNLFLVNQTQYECYLSIV